jgi:adenylate cyclase
MALRAAPSPVVEHGELQKRLRWMEVRAKLIDPQIASYGGYILRRTPDGLLVEFRTALEAVRCAVELQRDISAVNAGGGDLPAIELHTAIAPADAEAEGHGESTALALQERAEAGEITVSDSVREQIGDPPEMSIEPLAPAPGAGEPLAFRLIARPLGSEPPVGRAAPRSHASVAVLPFVGTVDGHPDDYFTSGIVENIVGLLARVSDLVVVSREATLMFRGNAVDLKTVGRQLAVRYVVTGAAERSGDRLRLTPRLVDTETSTVLWNVGYEVPLSKLFDLQDRISRRIVRALVPNLSRAELRRVETKRPESFDAYDLMLKAMHCMQRLDREEFGTARALLEGAIEKDPGYAAAYTLLARWYMLNLGQGYSVREHAERNSFLKAVTRAVELNPADAHALALLGHCKSWLFRDYDAALDCFERAFAASPNSAFAWGWSSPTCSYLGDGATAATHAEHAIRLSPYGPAAYVYRSALALARYTNGDYDEAARWGRRAMAIAPRYAANVRILAASLAAADKLDEAQAVGRALLALQPDFGVRRVAVGYSYSSKERNLALAAHLRLAGLPE